MKHPSYALEAKHLLHTPTMMHMDALPRPGIKLPRHSLDALKRRQSHGYGSGTRLMHMAD